MPRLLKGLLRLLLLLVILAALAAGGRALVLRKKAELAKAPKPSLRPTPVRVARARRGDFERRQSYLAVVEAIRRTDLAARLTAPVMEVLCDEGDRTEKGQALVRLDDQEIRDDIAGIDAQIEQTRADLAANEATTSSLRESLAYWMRQAARERKLADEGTISPSTAEGTEDKATETKGRLDAAVQRSHAIGHMVEALQKRKAQLTTRLGYCTIRSPYDGLVSRRFVDPGDLAVPGKVLLVVRDCGKRKLAFDAPQADLTDLKEGLPVTFRVGRDTRTVTLTHLYPTLDAARMLRAEVQLTAEESAGLTCGSYVSLQVLLERLPGVILVPASSLIEGPGKEPHVFVAENGRLQARGVEVLGATGEIAAIRGVKEAEQVVTTTFLGWARLSSGLPVEAIQ